MGKRQKKEAAELIRELEMYNEKGISLILNGKSSSPKAIAKAHRIAEEGSYMRDYVENEEGKVEELAFDRIEKA